ncbi:MAG TPA: peptidoglycan-binding protein, partial [Aestuariivirga sp.]|nr:peptidoglycan-binding protein [Aestuariivirga sp.]
VEISGVYDARTRLVVEAFQRHFRQERVDGIADQSTVTTLYRLLEAIPTL